MKEGAMRSHKHITRNKGKKSFKRNPLMDHKPSDITDLEIT